MPRTIQIALLQKRAPEVLGDDCASLRQDVFLALSIVARPLFGDTMTMIVVNDYPSLYDVYDRFDLYFLCIESSLTN